MPPSATGWNASDARRAARDTAPSELGLLVYVSRLLGADSTLVLAGGGNTSAKATVLDLHGEPVETLFVKGSGSISRAPRRAISPRWRSRRPCACSTCRASRTAT